MLSKVIYILQGFYNVYLIVIDSQGFKTKTKGVKGGVLCLVSWLEEGVDEFNHSQINPKTSELVVTDHCYSA